MGQVTVPGIAARGRAHLARITTLLVRMDYGVVVDESMRSATTLLVRMDYGAVVDESMRSALPSFTGLPMDSSTWTSPAGTAEHRSLLVKLVS